MEIIDEKIKKFLTANLGVATWEMIPIKKGGSDRNFFRICLSEHNSFIFMQYGEEKGENAYWVGIADFLKSIAVTVPAIIAHDQQLHFVLMEDLGDADLWSHRNLDWPDRRNYYYRVLDLVYKLYSFPLDSRPNDLRLMAGFDARLYHWEHNYFRENFVEAVCGLNGKSATQKELDDELNSLVSRLLKIPLCLIHRDLQSQNILIKNDQPVLIDFQGMRPGNFFYDLGSLICDPYVNFTAEQINDLLCFYYEKVKINYNRNSFEKNFWDASAQRLMQALGAYGFLGLKKKQPHFLGHIKQGVQNLITATAHSPMLPHLQELVSKCAAKQR